MITLNFCMAKETTELTENAASLAKELLRRGQRGLTSTRYRELTSRPDGDEQPFGQMSKGFTWATHRRLHPNGQTDEKQLRPTAHRGDAD